MTNAAFVFDTYALIEIIGGNKKYIPYLSSGIVINNFILAELCYNLLKEHGVEKSGAYVDKYALFAVRVDTAIIKEAMAFRFSLKKRKVSMIDCIGYIQAKKLGIKFLTGDKEFKDMDNIEFVSSS